MISSGVKNLLEITLVFGMILPGWAVQRLGLPNAVISTNQISVILIVDDSGSMKTNDPRNLRCTALRMFISLLDERDSVGVIRFSTKSESITSGFMPLAGNRIALISKVDSCAADGYTDLKAAFEDARRMLSTTDVDNPASVILLTDGKPEIESPYPGYEQDVLDAGRMLGVPVYSIALTAAADLNFLSQLSMATGAYVVPASKSSDLMDAYLQVFGTLKDRTVIGQGWFEPPEKIQLEIEPALSPYVERVSFLISKPEDRAANLVAPDGHIVAASEPQVEFFLIDDPRFMAVTISHPMGGAWRFELPGWTSGSVLARAILYSRLRAQVTSPIGFQEFGEPIPIIVRLTEEQENHQTSRIIGEAAFSAVVTRPDGTLDSLDQFYDDGTHGDLLAADGDYTRLYVNTLQTGEYHIVVRGWKGFVPVEQNTEFRVVQFPTLVIDGARGEYDIGDKPLSLNAHFTGGEPPGLDNVHVIARIRAPSGEIKEIELIELNGNYSNEFLPVENGKHILQVEARDATYLGNHYWDAAQVEFTVRILHQLSIGAVSTEILAGCFKRNTEVRFHTPINSLREEKIVWTLVDNQEFVLQKPETVIHPGEQLLEWALLPISEQRITPGEYNVQVQLTGSEDIQISPGRTIPLHFSIPSVWSRCRSPISWGLFSTVVLIAGLVGTVRRIRLLMRPSVVTGSLRCWGINSDAGNSQDFDFTGLKKTVITLGSGDDCDIAIKTGTLAKRHAEFGMSKTSSGVQVYLQPIESIKKGYGSLRGRVPLVHGDNFFMGDLNFQYLSDSGE